MEFVEVFSADYTRALSADNFYKPLKFRAKWELAKQLISVNQKLLDDNARLKIICGNFNELLEFA